MGVQAPHAIRRGLAWSSLSTIALRLGSVIVGIVLARILSPEDFGVYAIALTVQGILVTFVELGLSADLVRARDPAGRAPTVATISLAVGAALSATMYLAAEPLAGALGSPSAAPVIEVLSVTVLVAAAGVVPYASLQREMKQRELFASSALDFVLGTTISIVLVLLGWGPMALAIGRVVAQPVATAAQFMLAGVRLRFGFDRQVARSALAYGLPLAGANLLSIALLSIDKIVLARSAGEVVLGYYVLAFNISGWTMAAIGQMIRPVALAAFAAQARSSVGRADLHGRRNPDDGRSAALAAWLGPAWLVAVLAAVVLAAVSPVLVEVFYGERWSLAAPALVALAAFGALRVAFDLLATFLLAYGRSRPVLWTQLAWFVSLVPAMVVGVAAAGSTGAAWANVVVGIVVVLPAYAVAVQSAGVRLRSVAAAMWPPVLAAGPAFLVGEAVVGAVASPLPALVLGTLAAALVFSGLVGPWAFRRWPKSAGVAERAGAGPLVVDLGGPP